MSEREGEGARPGRRWLCAAASVGAGLWFLVRLQREGSAFLRIGEGFGVRALGMEGVELLGWSFGGLLVFAGAGVTAVLPWTWWLAVLSHAASVLWAGLRATRYLTRLDFDHPRAGAVVAEVAASYGVLLAAGAVVLATLALPSSRRAYGVASQPLKRTRTLRVPKRTDPEA